MQVYLAVQNAKYNTIIVKKRTFNNWWKLDGKASGGGTPALVNQAGQWALPGGKQESGESEIEGALREFREETGVQLTNQPGDQLFVHTRNARYALVVLRRDTVQDLVNAINANVAPNAANPMAPRNVQVEDWEVESALLVGLHALRNHLGVPQPVGPDVQHARLSARRYSQDIDWYGEMAVALSNL